MFHATTHAFLPERNLITNLELSPMTRSLHQGTSHRFVVWTLDKGLSCCPTNLIGTFTGEDQEQA